jgi:hypothetical protein
MVGTYENPGGAMAYAMRIARTEGHRIQCQAGMDACYKAKDMGADVLKQWDATLDARTRESHQQVDGQVRELDEKFSNGLMFPGDPSGGAAEVVNCRCALLQRARWAMDEDELQTLKDRAEYYGLDKTENFDDFKKQYLKAVESSSQTVSPVKVDSKQTKTFTELDDYMQKNYGVKLSSDIYNLDFETVQDAVAGVEWTMQQFPKTKGYLKKINTNKKGGVMNCTGDTISCNADLFDGHYYAGNHVFFTTTGVHESTHMLEGYLIDGITSSKKEFAVMWNDHTVAKQITKKAIQNLPDDMVRDKKVWQIYETISPDASINSSEAIAEAVSDVYKHGENASPLSKEIFKILKEMAR